MENKTISHPGTAITMATVFAASALAVLGYLYLTRSSSSSSSSKLVHREAKTHRELVEKMIQMKMLRNPQAIQAFTRVDRANYVDPEALKEQNLLSSSSSRSSSSSSFNPYEDHALPLRFNATISSPNLHALGLDLLSEVINPGDLILDIGSGSGFMTACLAMLAGSTGHVDALEHIPELVEFGRENVARSNPEVLDRIKFHEGDGLEGLEGGGPYKAIYFGAAAESLQAIQKLVDQLAIGGRMIVPIGTTNGFHHLLQLDLDQDQNVKVKNHGIVRFVPLVTKRQQLEADVTSGVTVPLNLPSGKRALVKTYVVPAPDVTLEEMRVVRTKLIQQRKELQEKEEREKEEREKEKEKERKEQQDQEK